MVQKITFYKLKPTDASPLNKENVRTNINWVYSGSFFFFCHSLFGFNHFLSTIVIVTIKYLKFAILAKELLNRSLPYYLE